MDYVKLGRTGLRVSRLCLGMMSYGRHESREWALDEADAEPIVRAAVEGGINFYDTSKRSVLRASFRAAPAGACALRTEDALLVPQFPSPAAGNCVSVACFGLGSDRCGGCGKTDICPKCRGWRRSRSHNDRKGPAEAKPSRVLIGRSYLTVCSASPSQPPAPPVGRSHQLASPRLGRSPLGDAAACRLPSALPSRSASDRRVVMASA
jgi:hypothetical protein